MSILCVSDLHWAGPERDNLEPLKSEIEEVDPSLILFAGDVISDSPASSYNHLKFTRLLSFLEDREIRSFTIQGNHDKHPNYDAVDQACWTYDYADEISGEVVEYNGLKIVGIPFEYTNSLEKARQLGDEFPGTYDIVLGHAERRKRIWLFELDAPLVISGHFGEMLGEVGEQVFASMSTYPEHRIMLQNGLEELIYGRETSSIRGDQERFDTKVKLDTEGLEWVFEELGAGGTPLRSLSEANYLDHARELIYTKRKIESDVDLDIRAIVEDLLDSGVMKTHIREYLRYYDL